MCSPPNPPPKKHFLLVSRLVVPALTAFSKSLCAFFLPEVGANRDLEKTVEGTGSHLKNAPEQVYDQFMGSL